MPNPITDTKAYTGVLRLPEEVLAAPTRYGETPAQSSATAGSQRLLIWINAFIPREIAGVTKPILRIQPT